MYKIAIEPQSEIRNGYTKVHISGLKKISILVDKSLMDSKKIVIIILLLLVCLLLFERTSQKDAAKRGSGRSMQGSYSGGSRPSVSGNGKKDVMNYIDSVNFHLRKTNNDIDRDRLVMEEENSRLQRYFTEGRDAEELPGLPQGTSFHESQASPYDHVMEDLEEGISHQFELSAADRVYLLKEQEILRRDYNKRYHEEFIRAFKESALKQGYVVDVDPKTLKLSNIRKVQARGAASDFSSQNPNGQSGR